MEIRILFRLFVFTLLSAALISLPSCGGGGGGSSGGSGPGVLINYYWPNTPYQLLPPDAESGERFGWSVDISGDIAIVGSGQYSGMAYIYERQADGSWDSGTKLVSPEYPDNTTFGNAVSIDGDTVLIGDFAAYDPGGAYFSKDNGAAYVFLRKGYGDWTFTAKLTASDPGSGTQFGYTLDLKGDLAIVGTKRHAAELFGSATTTAAYIFRRSGGIWGAPVKLVSPQASVGEYNEAFGHSVGIDGNYAVVGAHKGKGGGQFTLTAAGVVYVFYYDGNNWGQVKKLYVPDAEETDELGYSVAISGSWIIAGAPYKYLYQYGDYTLDGVAYLFYKPANGTWEPGYRIKSPEERKGAMFGLSVDIDGDTAVVGAPSECRSPCQNPTDVVGGAYVFVQSNQTWSWLYDKLSIPTDPAIFSDRFFGWAVAVDGNQIIIGDYEFFGNATDMPVSGDASIFEALPQE